MVRNVLHPSGKAAIVAIDTSQVRFARFIGPKAREVASACVELLKRERWVCSASVSEVRVHHGEQPRSSFGDEVYLYVNLHLADTQRLLGWRERWLDELELQRRTQGTGGVE